MHVLARAAHARRGLQRRCGSRAERRAAAGRRVGHRHLLPGRLPGVDVRAARRREAAGDQHQRVRGCAGLGGKHAVRGPITVACLGLLQVLVFLLGPEVSMPSAAKLADGRTSICMPRHAACQTWPSRSKTCLCGDAACTEQAAGASRPRDRAAAQQPSPSASCTELAGYVQDHL